MDTQHRCAGPGAARRAQAGFTLLELMITVAVVATMVTMSLPFFNSVIQSTQLKTNSQTFYGALTYARNEAVRRAGQVTLCKSSNLTSCSTSTSVSWADGWIIFVDTNKNYALDSGETIVRVQGELAGLTTTLNSLDSNFQNYIAFLPTGFSMGASAASGSFALCDERGAAKGRFIQVTNTGRIKMTDSPSSC